MGRFFLLLLLASAPLLAQTPASPSDNWVNQVAALQNHARQILRTELSRKIDPACDPERLSNAEFGNCFAADVAVTECNYQDFVQALKASLAIKPPDVDPKFPLPSKNFAEGEIAWRSYVDKTCAALGDTEYGASDTPTDMKACQQTLTRQHMKDLGGIYLKRYVQL